MGLERPDKQQATLGSAAILSEWLGVQWEAGWGGPSEHVTHLCTGPGFGVKGLQKGDRQAKAARLQGDCVLSCGEGVGWVGGAGS